MQKLLIKDLNFRYKNAGPDIIKDLNFSLDSGSFNVLYGPSGCGKSTLLKIIAGLYPEFSGHLTAGNIYLDGIDATDWNSQTRSQHIAILFQNPNDQFSMTTVKQEFIFTLENLGIKVSAMDQLISQALARVGIADFKNRTLNTLSGGELQKVSLAITLAMDCDLILLDEPFACVDSKSRQQLLVLLKDLQQNDGKTILITDHDLMGYQELIDNLYHFKDSQVFPVTNTQQIFDRYQVENEQLFFKLPDNTLDTAIKLQDFKLANGNKSLIDQSDLKMSQGKMILLTGENGAGKSTLFSAITRLHDYSGLIEYHNKDIQKYPKKKYARQIGLIFQDSQMQYLKLTVKDEIDLSLKYTAFKDFWTEDKISEYLTKLHLNDMDERIVYQLSGGQQKKLQIFEMLILGNPVLLMDEPLSGLDIDSTKVVMDMIQELSQLQKQTIIMISHQLGGLQNYFDYHLSLTDQKLTYTEVLNYEPIS